MKNSINSAEFEKLKKEKDILEEELKLANKKLLASEQFRSHFLSNIRNSISNPFSSAIGLCDHILHVDRSNWGKIESLVSLIHSDAFKLDFQLKNIFCTAELEAGQIYPFKKQTDIRDLFNKVFDKYKLVYQKRSISINFKSLNLTSEDTLNVYIDPVLLELVLVNLMDNAIKYSYEKKAIGCFVIKSDNNLSFTIHNEGKVIDQENFQLIFDRFYRIDSEINSIDSGNGLGLSIVKELVDIMGGEISLSSNKFSGTEFNIRIPLSSQDGFDNSFDSKEEEVFLPNEGELF